MPRIKEVISLEDAICVTQTPLCICIPDLDKLDVNRLVMQICLSCDPNNCTVDFASFFFREKRQKSVGGYHFETRLIEARNLFCVFVTKGAMFARPLVQRISDVFFFCGIVSVLLKKFVQRCEWILEVWARHEVFLFFLRIPKTNCYYLVRLSDSLIDKHLLIK